MLGANNVSTGYALRGLPPPAPHSSRRSGRVRLIAGTTAFLLGAVGGFLGWQALFGGFSFPGEITGAERVDSQFTEVVEMTQATMKRQLGLEIEVAVYGTASGVQYVMFAADIPDDADTLMRLAELEPSQVTPLTATTGSQVSCGPNEFGSACGWLSGKEIVGLVAVEKSPEQLSAIAQGLKADLE